MSDGDPPADGGVPVRKSFKTQRQRSIAG